MPLHHARAPPSTPKKSLHPTKSLRETGHNYACPKQEGNDRKHGEYHSREKGIEAVREREREREFIARQNIQSLAKIVWTRGGEIPKRIKQLAMTH